MYDQHFLYLNKKAEIRKTGSQRVRVNNASSNAERYQVYAPYDVFSFTLCIVSVFIFLIKTP